MRRVANVRRSDKYLSVAVFIAAVSFVVYVLAIYGIFDTEGRPFIIFTDIVPMAAAFFAILAILFSMIRFMKGESLRRFWALIAMSLALSLIANTIWFVYEGILQIEVTPVADVFWLLAYMPVLAALAGMLAGYKRLGLSLDWSKARWILPAPTAGILALGGFVAVPIFLSADATLSEKIFTPAYAIFDIVLLLAALVLLLTLGRSSAARPWALISLALASMGIGDIAFTWMNWHDLYTAGNLIDLFWVAGFLLMGLAAVYATEGLKPKVRRAAT